MQHPESLDVDIPGLGKFFIGGEWVSPSASTLVGVVSPTTEQVLVNVPDPTVAEADAAVAAARRAFDDGPWPRMSTAERVAVGTRFVDALERRMPDINRAWAFESGAARPHREAVNSTATPAIGRANLELVPTLQWEEIRTTPLEELLITRAPRGVVLPILTYNGAVILMTLKVLPALLAGNTVIIKSAPDSQLTSRVVSECFAEAGFPEGVVSVLAAGTEVTQHLVGHPGIDMVSLTGGAQIGIDVVQRAAANLTPTILELGGKGPSIILEDADLKTVIPALVGGSMAFLGQICTAQSRIFAPRSRYDEVAGALTAAFEAFKVGDPFDDSNDLGPVANHRAYERATRAVAQAVKDGGRILAGGSRPSHLTRGWFFPPTLIEGVDNSSSLCQEEVFGPVIAVLPYDSVDEAVKLANDSKYGLLASVFTSDQSRGLELARQLESGMVSINQASASIVQPFGGTKSSGWGRECGPEGVYEFTQLKTILLKANYALF